MSEDKYDVLLYYKYVEIPNLNDLLTFYHSNCSSLSLLGRVRLSSHDVNVTVSVPFISSFILFIPNSLLFTQECGFTSLSIRIIDELVTLSSHPLLKSPDISNVGKHLSALDFHSSLHNTIGLGGSLDENGETIIDALIMDGMTMEVGAVAAMRYVKDGIKVARLVMQHTKHTLLVGEKASEFAISMRLPGPMNLSSPESMEKWAKWKDSRCQPNFKKNVSPANSCGPYRPTNYLGHPDETCSSTV
ncbi:putative isoaspartyl peptidase/L-asparaginase 3 [Glycine soja]|nr:putative isoaspartyl peptidase/L-asparaginase 3 [Glycine soja]